MSDNEQTPTVIADAGTAGMALPAAPPPAQPAALPPAPPAAHLDAPSDDVVLATSAALPGEHHGGFARELTGPLPITASVHTELDWAPATASPLPRSAPWALLFGILGLIVSVLVGWGFLIGLVGAGLAVVALRRPWESRQAAVWALCLSVVSLIYSAGWLWWASTQGPLFG
ncbi:MULTISPECIES: hypothetical protein [unclassified Microbacterium]|uniref:hypothetical protein n=1 Tax=unclassified Microbacterium TaxID=2609290 RepID=UPI000AA73369|nr:MULTISPECIES: hypothetical protein [unclassified Microbacterium]